MVESVQIVAALRVKNESRWIKEVLDAIRWCAAIYLFDDHSTDSTREIARTCGATVFESPFDGFDEGRDKEWLIRKVADNHKIGTWVLMIDGDEVLEPGGEKAIRRMIACNSGVFAFSLRILYLWNSRKQIRVDGIYGTFNRPRLFKLMGQYSFKRTGVNGNLHCFCVPVANYFGFRRSQTALLHLGYMDKEDRIRKWKWYNGMDPVNRAEGYDAAHPERGSYPHIVQGDIPEIPAHIRLKHAGPLELRAL
jgi:glycosyltransferase involved in cell wall biosynthesis